VTILTGVRTEVYRIPLPRAESDGTLAWSATTVVCAHVSAAGATGLGWTYGPAAAASVIEDLLAPAVSQLDALDVPRAHTRMRRAVRNAPAPGLAALAISAVDVALWDLKARLLDVALHRLLGRARDRVPLYGSGGFVSLTDRQLVDQLGQWVGGDGLTAVKIKVGEDRGRHVRRDLRRVALARETIGPDVTLMIDANGGYEVKQAAAVAAAAPDVAWFEEPISADRLADLALLRSMVPAEIAAGEYGTTSGYFRQMCEAGAVDCLQFDATRCGGYTGALAVAAVADSFGLAVSAHCAPHLHAAVCAALPNLRHGEWFADHVYADRRLFDGLSPIVRGALPVAGDEPGHGLSLRADCTRWRIA
jgi:L-alanine-DL-glutamate epimerase-like enolase superfamily enzyme